MCFYCWHFVIYTDIRHIVSSRWLLLSDNEISIYSEEGLKWLCDLRSISPTLQQHFFHTFKKRMEETYDFSTAVETSLRFRPRHVLYCKKTFLFLTTIYETCTPQSDNRTPPASETKIRTKNLRKKATPVEFHDTDEQSSRVIDIFALRGKITRYNGDKLSRTLPFSRPSLSLSL